MSTRVRALAVITLVTAAATARAAQATRPTPARPAAKPAPGAPAGDLGETFASGVASLKAGKLDEAEAAFRRVIDGGAGGAYVHNNLGVVYQQRGQHAKAAAEFREAIRLDGADPAPRILLGESLLALGRTAEAQAELRKAVQIAPREPLARIELARAHQSAGDWKGAVEDYRVLVQIDPANPDFRYGLGTSYLRLSEQCLRELAQVAPQSARVHQAQGHGLRVQGQPDRALAAFARAAEADPSLPEIHFAMAQIHLEQGRYADARREAERELEIVPESAGARALLAGLARLEAGKP
jgi:tetratricopeptide (TPR) repeat protein